LPRELFLQNHQPISQQQHLLQLGPALDLNSSSPRNQEQLSSEFRNDSSNSQQQNLNQNLLSPRINDLTSSCPHLPRYLQRPRQLSSGMNDSKSASPRLNLQRPLQLSSANIEEKEDVEENESKLNISDENELDENELNKIFLDDENMARSLSNDDDKDDQSSDSIASTPRQSSRLEELFQSSPRLTGSIYGSTPRCCQKSQRKKKKASDQPPLKVGSTGDVFSNDVFSNDGHLELFNKVSKGSTVPSLIQSEHFKVGPTGEVFSNYGHKSSPYKKVTKDSYVPAMKTGSTGSRYFSNYAYAVPNKKKVKIGGKEKLNNINKKKQDLQ